jgi:PAS domain S-box-containing protein
MLKELANTLATQFELQLTEAEMTQLICDLQAGKYELEIQNEKLRLALYDSSYGKMFIKAKKHHDRIDILQSVLESPVGIIIFALDTNYCYSAFSKVHKETIKKIWGVDIKVGMNMLDVISYPEDRQKAKSNFDRVLKGEYVVLTEEYGDNLLYRTFYENYYSPIISDDNIIVGVSVFVIDITERENSQKALRESEQKYRLLAENTSDGILVIGTDTKIKYVSQSYLNQLGYTEVEELERNSETIYTMIHPDDRDSLFKKIFQAIENKETVLIYSYRVRHKNGHYIWREDHAKFNYDSKGTHLNTYVICRDITERKNADQLIRKLQKAVESSKTCILITDKEGNIEYANPHFAEATGYTIEEYIGKNPKFLKTELYEEPFYKNLWDTINSGKTWEGEFCDRKKNGETYWENAIISPITNYNNEITNFVAIKTDISESKKNHQELVRAKEHAEESDRLKTAFLTNMSHEIRTPMNGILGFSDLLKDPGISGEKQKDFLGMIEKCGRRMLSTISNILEISKIESGLVEMEMKQIAINQQMTEIFELLKPEADKKGLLLSYKKGLADKDAIVKIDDEKFFFILSNLVKNAIKFTDAGGVEFGYHIIGDQSIAPLQFYVKDTGIGIPKSRQEAIFERFTKADISNKRAFQGSGLGLTITRYYVELLGGKIWVESEESKGSVFCFTIPYTMDVTNKGIPEPLSPVVEIKNRIPMLNIIIAEDDEASSYFLTEILQGTAKEFIYAKTGNEVVEKCRNNPDIDLILMDIKMPDMSGLEAARHIREFNKEVIIIAQTAHALSVDKEMAIVSGCSDYISKPLEKKLLLEIIKKHFV